MEIIKQLNFDKHTYAITQSASSGPGQANWVMLRNVKVDADVMAAGLQGKTFTRTPGVEILDERKVDARSTGARSGYGRALADLDSKLAVLVKPEIQAKQLAEAWSTTQPLFDASNLSPEAADIYKASLSREVQATNDALNRSLATGEPEQQAVAKAGDSKDLKLDRAGEASYQKQLKAGSEAILASTKAQSPPDPFGVSSRDSLKQQAARQAQEAPVVSTGRRVRF